MKCQYLVKVERMFGWVSFVFWIHQWIELPGFITFDNAVRQTKLHQMELERVVCAAGPDVGEWRVFWFAGFYLESCEQGLEASSPCKWR